MIHNELKKMMTISLPKKPAAFLLGILGPEFPQRYRKVFLYGTAAARILFAQKWKQEGTPSKDEWL